MKIPAFIVAALFSALVAGQIWIAANIIDLQEKVRVLNLIVLDHYSQTK